MKRFRLADLPDSRAGHFLSGILPGKYLCMGGMGFKPPGFRTHTNDGAKGKDLHVHEGDCEAFVILQGKARMEINGETHTLVTGDVCVVEPGEDHHLVSDENDPCVNLWLHAGDHRHADQV